MISVKVKTLTGSDFPFEVSDELTIRQFKEHISQTVNVPADRQRLIFQGRVLQDERKLSEIGLDHRTVHLVERVPGVPGGGSGGSSPLFQRRSGVDEAGARAARQGGHGHRRGGDNVMQQQLVVGAVALPSGDMNQEQIRACLRRILNRIGDIGRRAVLDVREAPDGSSVQADLRLRTLSPFESSPNADGTPGRRRVVDSPATERVQHIRHVIRHAEHILHHMAEDENATDQSPTAAADHTGQEPHQHPSSTDPECDNCGSHHQPSIDAFGQHPDVEYFHLVDDTLDGVDVQIRQTRISALAPLLDEIQALESRLAPFLDRYRTLLRDDANYDGNETRARRDARLFNGVQTLTHNLAHVYHTFSDLNVHFCQASPRDLYPQLLGSRAAASNNSNNVHRESHPMMAQVHTSAEVQITMNFQRGDGQEQTPPPPRQPSPQPPRPAAPPQQQPMQATGMIMQQLMQGFGAIRPPQQGQGQQQPQQQGGDMMQAIMQGLTGGLVTGTRLLGMGGGPVRGAFFGGSPQQQHHQHQFRMPPGAPTMPNPYRPAPIYARPPGQPPANQQQQPQRPQRNPGGASGGATGQSQQRAMHPPQNLGFSAVPYNPSANHQSPAVFVGYDPPTMLPLYTFDEYMPCSSRHFDPRQRPSMFAPRRASNQQQGSSTNQAGATSSSTNQEPTTTAVEQPSRMDEREAEFEQHLEPIVRSVVNSLQETFVRAGGAVNARDSLGVDGHPILYQYIPLFGVQGPTTGGGLRARSGQRPQQMNAVDGMMMMNPMRRPSSDPNLARQQQEGAAGGASAGRQRTVSTAAGTAGAPGDRAMVEQIVRGVFDGMMGHSSQTIGDHFRTLGQEMEHSDSVLMEAAQLVVASLSFGDIWALFSGDSAALDRARPALRRHFVETVLNGNESPSEENIRGAAARAVRTDARLWQEMAANTTSTDDLDLAATMGRCENEYLIDVMMLVFGHNFVAGEEFGRRLYDRSWLYARQAVTAAIICCADGERGFDQFATRLCETSLVHVGPEFRQMFAASGVQHFRTLYTNHRLERSEVERFLVNKSDEDVGDESKNTASSATMEASGGESTTKDEETTEDQASSQSPAFATPPSSTTPLSRNDPMINSIDEASSKEATTSSSAAAASGGDSSTSEWRQHLSPEWARVVEVDAERQRAMSQQAPFSDAYLNGMPSKRRKLVLDQRPRAVLNAAATSTDSFLKEVLRQSIDEAGAKPITGEQAEDVIDHVSMDENGAALTETFADDVERRFGARLRREEASKKKEGDEEDGGDGKGKDFDPERFPNATQRFYEKK